MRAHQLTRGPGLPGAPSAGERARAMRWRISHPVARWRPNAQAAMACAANYAWVNRSSMTFLCRQVRALCERRRLPRSLTRAYVRARAAGVCKDV
jgi:hypothetical protein